MTEQIDRTQKKSTKRMLYFDSAAGLTWGLLISVLHIPIASLMGVPTALIFFQATANFTYALYSGMLALSGKYPDSKLRFLVRANFAYGVLCLGFLFYFFPVASVLGRVVLFLEFTVMALLAAFEHRVFFGAKDA